MKIELWSDYACPFCYIGEKRLEKALAEIDGGDKVEIEFKSFELDPYASRKVVSSTVDRFAAKYHLSKEEAAERIEAISRMGRSEGIDFRYVSTRYTNTFDSLRLTKYAQEKGKTGIITKLFDAYFTKNLKLSDHDVLTQIAGECGLDKDEVTAVLSGDRYADEVRADEQEAMEHGIHGVPYFLINGKYTASGAQPTAMLKEAIERILAEETSAATSLDGMVCGVDGRLFARPRRRSRYSFSRYSTKRIRHRKNSAHPWTFRPHGCRSANPGCTVHPCLYARERAGIYRESSLESLGRLRAIYQTG